MRIPWLLVALFLVVHGDARAIDASDIGSYRLLNVKREPTEMVMRLVGSAGRWKIEEKKANGSWVDVTCEAECELHQSDANDQKRFFPADDLSKVTMSCVHNTVFAFCRYGRKAIKGERGYVFVALTEAHPIALGLQREQ